MLGNVIFQECLSFISAFVVELSWGCWECASSALLFGLRHCPCAPCAAIQSSLNCGSQYYEFILWTLNVCVLHFSGL